MQDHAESWVEGVVKEGKLSDVHGRRGNRERWGYHRWSLHQVPNQILARCVNLSCCMTVSRGESMQCTENTETTLVTPAPGEAMLKMASSSCPMNIFCIPSQGHQALGDGT